MFDSINKWLDGKKTIIAGIGGVGTFLTVLAGSLSDGFQADDVQTILVAFTVMMAIFGIGGKLAKITNAINSKN